ncbi:hypothetical protein SRHO_G00221940, partial [Serrasalmus rhombeus]
LQRQRAAAAAARVPGGPGVPVLGHTGSPSLEKKKEEAQRREKEREKQERREEEVLRLQAHCEEQAGQLQALRAELRRSTLGLDAFAVCTQHFCLK